MAIDLMLHVMGNGSAEGALDLLGAKTARDSGVVYPFATELSKANQRMGGKGEVELLPSEAAMKKPESVNDEDMDQPDELVCLPQLMPLVIEDNLADGDCGSVSEPISPIGEVECENAGPIGETPQADGLVSPNVIPEALQMGVDAMATPLSDVMTPDIALPKGLTPTSTKAAPGRPAADRLSSVEPKSRPEIVASVPRVASKISPPGNTAFDAAPLDVDELLHSAESSSPWLLFGLGEGEFAGSAGQTPWGDLFLHGRTGIPEEASPGVNLSRASESVVSAQSSEGESDSGIPAPALNMAEHWGHAVGEKADVTTSDELWGQVVEGGQRESEMLTAEVATPSVAIELEAPMVVSQASQVVDVAVDGNPRALASSTEAPEAEYYQEAIPITDGARFPQSPGTQPGVVVPGKASMETDDLAIEPDNPATERHGVVGQRPIAPSQDAGGKPPAAISPGNLSDSRDFLGGDGSSENTDSTALTPSEVSVADGGGEETGKLLEVERVPISEGKPKLQETQSAVGSHATTDGELELTRGADPDGQSVQRATVTPRQLIDQIVQTVELDVTGEYGEVRLQLKPEHLGELQVKVATNNGVISATFIAESHTVKSLIEAGLSQLKEQLTQQGLHIQDVSVQVGGDSPGRQSYPGGHEPGWAGGWPVRSIGINQPKVVSLGQRHWGGTIDFRA